MADGVIPGFWLLILPGSTLITFGIGTQFCQKGLCGNISFICSLDEQAMGTGDTTRSAVINGPYERNELRMILPDDALVEVEVSDDVMHLEAEPGEHRYFLPRIIVHVPA